MSATFGQALAQAITDQIASATWTLTFTPKRRYAARWLKLDNADTGRINIDVCQGKESVAVHSRGQKRQTIEIQIAIRKRFNQQDQGQDGQITTEAIDALNGLQGEILTWLNSAVANWAIDVSTATGLTAAVAQMTTAPIKSEYVPQHLLTLNQYTGILTVEFFGVLTC
jgi:hypothetical protein